MHIFYLKKIYLLIRKREQKSMKTLRKIVTVISRKHKTYCMRNNLTYLTLPYLIMAFK